MSGDTKQTFLLQNLVIISQRRKFGRFSPVLLKQSLCVVKTCIPDVRLDVLCSTLYNMFTIMSAVH